MCVRSFTALFFALLAGPALAQGPLPDPIVKGSTQAVLRDVVQVPPSSTRAPLARLNLLGHAGDGSGRLFVNDMRGKLWVIEDGAVQAEPFLDVAAALGSDFDQAGLQVGFSTFAFHPDFATRAASGFGKLYTAHSEVPDSATPDFGSPLASVTHHSVVAEWSLDAALGRIDPTSKRELLRVAESTRDHNVGQIAFSPTAAPGTADYGNLYIAFGDGGMIPGGEIDPARTAQDRSNPFGSILRIDPLGSSSVDLPTNGQYGIPDDNPSVDEGDGSLGEIYAHGFRNPHRFSWDTAGDGKLIVSDIGQANIEEIDVVVAKGNYGWSEREGFFQVDHSDQNILLPLPADDDLLGYVYPAAQYDHDEGRAVVGGFVYRGSLMPSLVGRYVFGDVVNGRIFTVDVDDLISGNPALIEELTLFYEGEERDLIDILGTGRADLRFGVDEAGEIYVLTKRDGMVRMLVPEPGSGLLVSLGLSCLASLRSRRPCAGPVQDRCRRPGANTALHRPDFPGRIPSGQPAPGSLVWVPRMGDDSTLQGLESPIFGPGRAAEPVAPGRYGFVKPEHEHFPPILIIAVTNLCDMACIHCAHPVVKKSPGYRGTFMDPDVHSRIVEQTAPFRDKLWVLRYAADGESMLHPRFLDFVEEAKRAGIGPVDLTTNAMSLTEERMRRLLEAPIDLIDVSLDAFSREAYEKIRIRGKFDVVTANLKRLVELRNELGSPTRIMTSIIRQKEAEHEVEAFRGFWGPYVDEVLVRGLNTDLGIVNVSETYFEEELQRWPCPQFWKRVTINHDGDIRFCVEDWFNKGVVANVRDHTIQEVWQSPLYRKFRELHESGRWHEMKMCSGCMDWQHMEWDHGFEKAVNKVMGKAPLPVVSGTRGAGGS